jgi:hypothetical protein
VLALVDSGSVEPPISTLAAALLGLAIGGLVIAALVLGRRRVLPSTAVDFVTWSGVVAAALSFGAAAIHFAVIGEHFAEFAPYGVAFAAFAWFQVGWAVLYVWRRSRGLSALAILVNLGALVVWAVSRIAGLPVGPEPGQIEPVGPLDLLAGGLEAALIGLLAWDLAAVSERRRPALSPVPAVIGVGSALLAIVVLTSAAFALSGGTGHSAAEHDHAPASADGTFAPAPSDPRTRTESPPVADTSPVATSSPLAVVGQPGIVAFGTTLDLAGQLQGSTARFRPGQTAIWLADLSEPVAESTVRFIIVQVLPDGRELEHWRQDMAVADPGGRQLVGMADLSIYVHGGAGSYRMRYFRGDELLAAGTFELIP